jgi:hypothetical protein
MTATASGGPVSNTNVLPVGIQHANNQIIDSGHPLDVRPNNESIYSAPWDMQVARGKVPGVTQVNVFGYGTAIDGTFIPAWENATAYTFPASAINIRVVSSSASDDTAASINISGLDANWNLLTEHIHLNGTTVVTTTNQFLRINSVLMVSPGTGQVTNVGTITLTNGSGTIHGQINPGVSRMQNSWYSVPAGYGLYIQNINAFTGETKQGNTPTWMYYRVLVKDNINGVQRLILQTSFQNEYKVQRFNPVKYGEKSDVQWQFSSSSGSVSLGLILEAVLISDSAP